MTWNAFRNRGEVLRAVSDEANLRRDGALPLGLPGVRETFADDLDLTGALQLRWYTRLSGQIERHLADEPTDLPAAVRRAWLATADELPGVRVILDRQREHPTSDAVAEAMARATANEQAMMALLAGLSGVTDDRRDPHAVDAGRRLEEAARASYRPALPMPDPATTSVLRAVRDLATARSTRAARTEVRVPSGSAAFVERIKAVLAG